MQKIFWIGIMAMITMAGSMNAQTYTVYVTFYGYVDNDPPGRGIAYPVIHAEAGGTGTYDDPISFATDPREHAPGTIVYVPYLKKYFIMEDLCGACVRDWNMGRRHIDLWTGGDEDSGDDLIQCEKFLTRSRAEIIVNPPSDLEVVKDLLFDAKTGECYQP